MGKVKRIFAVLLAVAIILPPVPVDTAKGAESVTYLTEKEVSEIYTAHSGKVDYGRVSVHDPSIVIGYYDGDTYTGTAKVYGEQNEAKTRKKVYFIFGTHRAFAYSTDLKNWKNFTNNINNDTTARALFKDGESWSKRGDSVYSLVSRWGTNLWAPDVAWNPYYQNADGSKGAWVMYMSVNGCSWNSSIALLTSDSLNGDWTYQGTVVYSGFDDGTTYDYTATDYREVTGDAALPSRYLGGAWQWADGNTKCTASKWNTEYGAHAIDPCVLIDGSDMWMTYGSWSGGIYMIKLDRATGLRDRLVKYEFKPNVSDPYMGLKLAGGSFASGEASYIKKIDNKYYLFVTNGGLNADGGYNMRVFSSDRVTGPYKDMTGDDARYAKRNVSATYENGTYTLITNNEDNINGTVGSRLMSYYKWDFMSDGNTAQGHNSVMVDDDGKKYVIYHTRFVINGFYEDRVHQMFVAKNGGLVAAPFEYSGETLSKTAYNKEQLAGDYKILTMGDVNYGAKECVTEKAVSLNADGTVSGEYTGTWQQDGDGPYVTLNCGKNTYKGVFVEQNVEGSNWPAMCFTVVGDNDISILGYRIADDKLAVVKNAVDYQCKIKADTYSDLVLDKTLSDGVVINWESSKPDVISKDGKVTLPKEDTEVTMTAVISRGEAAVKKEYKTKVYAKGLDAVDIGKGLMASYSFNDGNTANGKNPAESAELLAKGNVSKPVVRDDDGRGSKVLHTYIGNGTTNSYAKIKNPLKGKNVTGAAVSMWVKCDDRNVWGEIWSFYDDKNTRLFLTQNAFLGYNNGEVYFDCNNGATVTNAIGSGTWKLVTVTVDKDGYGIYIDGKLKYDKQEYAAYGGADYDEAMGQRQLDLFNRADNFYIGYGGFWGSGALSVDNIKIYDTSLGDSEVYKLYKDEKAEMDSDISGDNADKDNTDKDDTDNTDKDDADKDDTDNTDKDDADKDDSDNADKDDTNKDDSDNTDKDDTNDEDKDDGAGDSDSRPQNNNAVTAGKTYTVGSLKYKVTGIGNGKNSVTVQGVKSKNIVSATVNAAVKIKGKTFKIKQVGAGTFANCKKLKKVTIGPNVTKIGSKAFYNCNKLKNITIKGKNITVVGKNALKGINKGAKIKVPSSKLNKYKKLFNKKGQKSTVKVVKN